MRFWGLEFYDHYARIVSLLHLTILRCLMQKSSGAGLQDTFTLHRLRIDLMLRGASQAYRRTSDDPL